MILSPSIYNAGTYQLEKTLQELEEAGAKYLHVDIMDNHFVPNLSFGPGFISDLKKMTKLVLDVHLMIEKPEDFIKDYCQAGADILTVHYEATRHLHYVIQEIEKYGKKAGVAINPATPVSSILPILNKVHQVLVMTINPGRSNQKLIPETLEKIEELREIRYERNLAYDIEVDGNISVNNIRKVVSSGANVIVSGGGIFNEAPIGKNIQQLISEAI